MIVTVDVKNQVTLNLLRNLESLGLIHMKPPVQEDAATSAEPESSWRWMIGCCQDSGDTLEAYFERKRRDKEEELAQEQRQAEERARYAKISS